MPHSSLSLLNDTIYDLFETPDPSQHCPAQPPSRRPQHSVPNPIRTDPPSQPAQIPSQPSPTPLITPSQGRKRAAAEIGWERDGGDNHPSSGELLLQWMEHPGHFDFYNGAVGGGNQTKGAVKCSDWLKRHNCPTPRSTGAIQRKVPISSPSFRIFLTLSQINLLKKNYNKAVDWRDGTGNGVGGRRITRAADEEMEAVIQDVQGTSFPPSACLFMSVAC